MRVSVKCFRLGPSAQISKTKLKAKITPKNQMYFAALNLEGSWLLVVEFSGVDGFNLPVPRFRATFSYDNVFCCFFFRLVGIILAKMASMGPMMSPAHINSAATPKMT